VKKQRTGTAAALGRRRPLAKHVPTGNGQQSLHFGTMLNKGVTMVLHHCYHAHDDRLLVASRRCPIGPGWSRRRAVRGQVRSCRRGDRSGAGKRQDFDGCKVRPKPRRASTGCPAPNGANRRPAGSAAISNIA
jgi:hypothetical protein